MTQGPNSTTPALVAERFVEAFNARDEQRLRKLYHPEARIKRPTWPSEGDVAASLASIQLDFGAYPDGQIEVRQVVVQDRLRWSSSSSRGRTPSPSPCSTARRYRRPVGRFASTAPSFLRLTSRA